MSVNLMVGCGRLRRRSSLRIDDWENMMAIVGDEITNSGDASVHWNVGVERDYVDRYKKGIWW